MLNKCSLNKIKLIIAMFFLYFSANLCADSFQPSSVLIQGNVKMSKDTILHVAEVKPGDTFSKGDYNNIIVKLFKTGWFNDVKIEKDKDILKIIVKENPSIFKIIIHGNDEISTSKIKEILTKVNVVPGQIIDMALNQQLKNILLAQYNQLGRKNTKVDVEIKNINNGRADLVINIIEDESKVIRNINFVGNKNIYDRKILNELSISRTNFSSFFSNSDKYSEESVNKAIDDIRELYLDNGYYDVKVTKEIKEEKNGNGIFITFIVEEGHVYTVENIDIRVPDGYVETGFEKKATRNLLLSKGSIYSQTKLKMSETRLTQMLNDLGYSFSKIRNTVKKNKLIKNTLEIVIFASPGSPTYINKVNIYGNNRTKQNAIRQNIYQSPAQIASLYLIKESKRRINNLGFISGANYEISKSESSDNQVDLSYSFEEKNSLELLLEGGIGTNGAEVKLKIHDKSFRGTGNQALFSIGKTTLNESIQLSYSETLYDSRINFLKRTLSLQYSVDKPVSNPFSSSTKDEPSLTTQSGTSGTKGKSVNKHNRNQNISAIAEYSFPISYFEEVSVSLSLTNKNKLYSDSASNSAQLNKFRERFGKKFNDFSVTLGYDKTTLDRRPFPTSGSIFTMQGTLVFPFLERSISKNSYYRMKVGFDKFISTNILNNIVLKASLKFGYTGTLLNNQHFLPDSNNFTAGGVGVDAIVRGYESGQLGPKDSNKHPVGGNLVIYGGVSLILPEPISTDSMRFNIFLDCGQTFNYIDLEKGSSDYALNPTYTESLSLKNLRMSAGLGIDLITPMGPLSFSFGFPIGKHIGATNANGTESIQDQTQFFEFSISTGL